MKILFTIAGLQPEYGGPSHSVPALAAALARQGVEIELLTCESLPGQPQPLLPPPELVKAHLLPPACRSTRWLARSNAFAITLRRVASPCPPFPSSLSTLPTSHLLHDHGLWLPTNHAAAFAARSLGVPRIVSPRGMLTAWALQHRGWKKRIAWWLYQHRDLQSAQVLHATSQDEAEAFRAAGLKLPIAILPNGVELPPSLPRPIPSLAGAGDAPRPSDGRGWLEGTGEGCRRPDEGRGENKSLDGRVTEGEVSNVTPNSSLVTRHSSLRTLLFLGRIHPVKGLLDLVNAWAEIRNPQWRVVLAGGDEDNHRAELESAIRARGLEQSFSFAGAVAGDARWECYRAADLFVLPSHSENFGIVVAEALACGVPVITTRGTPWAELATKRCGWWVDLGVEPLAAALREAVTLPDDARREMGRRGREWVEAKFAWPAIAAQMRAVYEWMLGQGPKPECVEAK